MCVCVGGGSRQSGEGDIVSIPALNVPLILMNDTALSCKYVKSLYDMR